jgi:broad specificity phosphatase PhoE
LEVCESARAGTPPIVRLILVRHGDAFAGLRGVIAGPTGCRGLTDLGRRQAAALRDSIVSSGGPHVDALVTSTLPRAIETAGIIAPELGFDEVAQDCDLCEVHTGEADGLEWAEYSSRFGAVDMLDEPERPFAPGGDSWSGFHTRVDAVMTRLARDHPDEVVMAVCHSGVISASVRVRLGARLVGGARLIPTNTGLTEWEYDEPTRQWTLRRYDDAHHLGSMG